MKGNPQVWGWVLLALGGLFLLQTLGVAVVGWVWGLIFAAGGAVFLGCMGATPRAGGLEAAVSDFDPTANACSFTPVYPALLGQLTIGALMVSASEPD